MYARGRNACGKSSRIAAGKLKSGDAAPRQSSHIQPAHIDLRRFLHSNDGIHRIAHKIRHHASLAGKRRTDHSPLGQHGRKNITWMPLLEFRICQPLEQRSLPEMSGQVGSLFAGAAEINDHRHRLDAAFGRIKQIGQLVDLRRLKMRIFDRQIVAPKPSG